MQTKLDRTPFERIETDALIVPVFEGAKEDRFGAAALVESGEIAGKSLEFTLLHNAPGVAAKRVLLAGAGKREKFNEGEMRKLAGAAVRHLKPKSIKRLALVLEGDLAAAGYVAAAVEGALLGDFEPDHLKTGNDKKTMDEFAVAAQGDAALDAAFTRGCVLADAQNFTRELVNRPSNLLPPHALAAAAREMASSAGLECEVLDEAALRTLGMGALLGVAQGSAEPPCLIVIRYRPAAAPASSTHLGLVGKGVTFDTGGISIKPSEGMEKMKYDMAGGATMIGVMRALAELKPAIPVTAFIPAVENMPGSRAQRPGDIVTTLSGKTVEVLNTDAEGRLILADAITYARRQGATHLVDAATLTGAIVVALGHLRTGLFTNNDALRDRVQASAQAEGERFWELPMDDDYKDYLKSAFADLPNIGGRYGGSITAAMFLKEFADETPWVHLDIAGTAWLDDNKPFLAKGPSGVTVRTLISLATGWKD